MIMAGRWTPDLSSLRWKVMEVLATMPRPEIKGWLNPLSTNQIMTYSFFLDYIMLNDNRLSHSLTWKQIGNKRTGITHGAVGPMYFINDNSSLELMWSANI